ncbi:MAG: hypothetical protein U5L76_05155 [Patescibacteria group bacterium]|nr:hypothetical protein [Patescibacteria group bacterium]
MAIFDKLKSIGSVLKEANKIEEYKQIIEIQQELLNLTQKNASLIDKNKNLKEKLKLKEKIVFEYDSYWTVEEGSKKGPYCTACWDNKNKLIRLQSSKTGYRRCPICDNVFNVGFPNR